MISPARMPPARSFRRFARPRFGYGALGLLGALAILMSLPAQPAQAEDAVYLKPPRAGEPLVRIRGQIRDYTGRELRMQNTAGRERVVPASQIYRVETTHSPEQTAGDQLYQAGDFRGAVGRYRAALDASREKREWVRRQIMVQLVWCLRNLQEWDQAGETFLILLASDPTTADFACLPLVWNDVRPEAAIERKAAEWLADANRPTAMLMGASQLLTTAQRPQAIEKLQSLLADADPRIAWLAFSQLWRAGSANATADQRRSFAQRIEASDPALRAGAYFVLGRALAGDQPEDAALALMRVPIEYDREYELAALSLIEAGACLEKLDRATQAAGLYREVGRRFSQSAAAPLADKHLQRLAAPAPARDNGA